MSSRAESNGCAVFDAGRIQHGLPVLTACFLMVALGALPSAAQDEAARPHQVAAKGKAVAVFVAGGAIGLAAHEAGHLLADAAFGQRPGVRKVDFHGIPFFAITHAPGQPPRREFTISSAGFWVQHAGNEWLLKDDLRRRRAPLAKGVLTFNVVTSVAYAGAAFGRTGPDERDTRGMAASSRLDERWIGALVLAPALLDTWRYFHPDARWAAWTSRGVKIGMVVLVAR
jgi:hypothetical protein